MKKNSLIFTLKKQQETTDQIKKIYKTRLLWHQGIFSLALAEASFRDLLSHFITNTIHSLLNYRFCGDGQSIRHKKKDKLPLTEWTDLIQTEQIKKLVMVMQILKK
jgi:hypothetical protein